MTMIDFDIDIDVQSGVDKSQFGTRASIYNQETEKFLPHPSGIYLDEVPVDPETNRCAIPYDDPLLEDLDKIDILTNTSYDIFKSKQELLECLEREPDWNLLLDQKVLSKLPHIGKHFDLVSKIKPSSIQELADTLALIRPGKIGMLADYLKNPKLVRLNLYRKPKYGAYFKKSHAISYAMMIKAILNHPKSSGGIIW